MDINNLLEDEKLNILFKQLNISEENGKVLCRSFYEFFTTTATTEMYLKKIKDCLSTLATTSRDDNKFQEVVKEIADCVGQHSIVFHSTVKRLHEVEKQTELITEEIMQMKEQKKLNDALIISNEISSLYIEYIIKPVLFETFQDPSWDHFCNKLSKIENQLDITRLQAIRAGERIDDEQLYKPLVTFLQPLQKKIPLSLTDIQFLRTDRNNLVHIRHKNNIEQWLLLDKAKEFEFSEMFEFKQIVKDMIASLEQHRSIFH